MTFNALDSQNILGFCLANKQSFINLFDIILDIILYIASTNDISLYSFKCCGLPTFGISEMNEELFPLAHFPHT